MAQKRTRTLYHASHEPLSKRHQQRLRGQRRMHSLRALEAIWKVSTSAIRRAEAGLPIREETKTILVAVLSVEP
jgi:hypothetical protein